MKTSLYFLANSEFTDPVIAVENSEIDQDGWALVAPFGEFPKSRLTRTAAGVVQENFIQVLDNAAMDDLLKTENGFFRKLKRALVGIPVYFEHPDLALHSPQTINLGNAKSIPVGVVDNIRRADRGMEAHFSLLAEGAAAVEGGAKFISPFWQVKLIETLANGTHRVRPFKLVSVGLTANPTIKENDSLANSNQKTATEENENMKLQLIGWLAAQSVVLANDAADSLVLEAIQKLHATKGTEVITLANAKDTALGKITTLENANTDLTGKLTAAQTALANAETNFKTERQGRAAAVADLVIQQGKADVAGRDALITALANATDFAVEAGKLDALPVKYKTAPVTGDKGKGSAATDVPASQQLIALANSEEYKAKYPTWDAAWTAAKAANPNLVEKMKLEGK